MRKHIASALKARSQAIRTALDRYNMAALSLTPPRPLLDWDEIVTYAFLSDFDLLRDTRQDVRTRPWAKPAARLAIDQWHKLLRAEEEICRLNVEIARFQTYLHDEEDFLRLKEAEISRTDPGLGRQVWVHRMERARYNEHHQDVLNKIYGLSGFSGKVCSRGESSRPAVQPPDSVVADVRNDVQDEHALGNEQDEEDDDVEVLTNYCSLLDLSFDTNI